MSPMPPRYSRRFPLFLLGFLFAAASTAQLVSGFHAAAWVAGP